MARARINIRPRNPKLPLFRFLEWLAVVVSVVLVLVLILFVMMTPVVITVVGGTILTPILLKLVFKGQTESRMAQNNGLSDRYEKVEQLDIVSEQLLEKDRNMMKSAKKR